ncbi:helix-turn-helix transcriptional regulator [Arcobacteraceae bacterium]|nr:helix-turn-helix transcriptional regulator [Arcobacteraceae bacterium]
MNKKINNLTAESLHKLIGANVARLRKKANLSQLALSIEMGHKSPSLISSAEIYTNKRHFNIVQLQTIAKILDVEICDFFSTENS